MSELSDSMDDSSCSSVRDDRSNSIQCLKPGGNSECHYRGDVSK